GVHSVVVSQALARQLFGGADPLGKRIRCGWRDEWYQVIGVAADARNVGFDRAAEPEYYLVRKAVPDDIFANAEPPLGWRAGSVAARTAIDPRFLAASLRGAIAELDPTLPVEVETMHQRLDTLTEQPRFYATLLAVFAAAGATLAAIGLFGVLSFLVAQR